MFGDDITTIKAKALIMGLKEDLRKVKKGKMRSFHIVPVAVKSQKVYEYMKARDSYIRRKMAQEKERAWNFLIDESQAEKYGWYSRKQNPQQLQKWAEQAFPHYKLDEWEIEYDIQQLVEYLKLREKNGN